MNNKCDKSTADREISRMTILFSVCDSIRTKIIADFLVFIYDAPHKYSSKILISYPGTQCEREHSSFNLPYFELRTFAMHMHFTLVYIPFIGMRHQAHAYAMCRSISHCHFQCKLFYVRKHIERFSGRNSLVYPMSVVVSIFVECLPRRTAPHHTDAASSRIVFITLIPCLARNMEIPPIGLFVYEHEHIWNWFWAPGSVILKCKQEIQTNNIT